MTDKDALKLLTAANRMLGSLLPPKDKVVVIVDEFCNVKTVTNRKAVTRLLKAAKKHNLYVENDLSDKGRIDFSGTDRGIRDFVKELRADYFTVSQRKVK